ncbi:MAG: hypothetical protein MR210_05385 [Erysipelotrichaceae bacterium]|nr:hypothetical protein [Erysipelotrichaceae bacterium]MDY5252407.1 hypothetical protein [Erysipelotrichaceae bacterium]
MKILIAPMNYISKNLSCAYKIKRLAQAFDDVAIVGNAEYHNKNYPFFPTKTLRYSSLRLNQNNKLEIKSFDEFLYHYKLLDKLTCIEEIETIIKAINEYKPQAIYTHYNLNAIIAALLTNTKCYGTYSYYLHRKTINAKAINALNRILSHYQLPQVLSLNELYEKLDHKFIFSSANYQPVVEDEKTTFVGEDIDDICSSYDKHIVVSLANAIIPEKKQIKIIKEAFLHGPFDVDMCSNKTVYDEYNLHISNNLIMSKSLKDASVFIHDGSDVNTYLALQYRVPQIIITNNFYTHQANASIMYKNNGAFRLSQSLFNVKYIYEDFKALIDNDKYQRNMQELAAYFQPYGGCAKIKAIIEQTNKNDQEDQSTRNEL